MRLGPLNKRITFQAPKSDKDDFGNTLPGWDDVATVWASIEPISSRELMASQQVQGEVTHRIRTRYRAGLTAANRIMFKGRVFDMQTPINPLELGASLEILAKEGLTDG